MEQKVEYTANVLMNSMNTEKDIFKSLFKYEDTDCCVPWGADYDNGVSYFIVIDGDIVMLKAIDTEDIDNNGVNAVDLGVRVCTDLTKKNEVMKLAAFFTGIIEGHVFATHEPEYNNTVVVPFERNVVMS